MNQRVHVFITQSVHSRSKVCMQAALAEADDGADLGEGEFILDFRDHFGSISEFKIIGMDQADAVSWQLRAICQTMGAVGELFDECVTSLAARVPALIERRRAEVDAETDRRQQADRRSQRGMNPALDSAGQAGLHSFASDSVGQAAGSAGMEQAGNSAPLFSVLSDVGSMSFTESPVQFAHDPCFHGVTWDTNLTVPPWYTLPDCTGSESELSAFRAAGHAATRRPGSCDAPQPLIAPRFPHCQAALDRFG